MRFTTIVAAALLSLAFAGAPSWAQNEGGTNSPAPPSDFGSAQPGAPPSGAPPSGAPQPGGFQAGFGQQGTVQGTTTFQKPQGNFQAGFGTQDTVQGPQTFQKPQGNDKSKGIENWRYKFYGGNWCYWMPDNHWMVFVNGGWVTYDQYSAMMQGNAGNMTYPQPYSSGYGSYSYPSYGGWGYGYGYGRPYWSGSWGGHDGSWSGHSSGSHSRR